MKTESVRVKQEFTEIRKMDSVSGTENVGKCIKPWCHGQMRNWTKNDEEKDKGRKQRNKKERKK